MVRFILGYCVALWQVFSGMRGRQLRRYDVPGAFLAIVCHDPFEKVFVGVIIWLIKHGFTFVSPDDLFAIRDGRMQWRPRMVWLSFDDGWMSFKTRILPILEKYSVKATLFIAPNETKRGQVWTNSIMPYIPYAKIREMYYWSSNDRYTAIDEILIKEKKSRKLMDEQTIRALSHHPLVTVENHTFTHLSCSHRPVSEVVAEVNKAQRILTEWSKRTPRMVCYPFGHCNKETDDAIKELGLAPVSLDAGVSEISKIGFHRNLICDRFSIIENVCRALNAWIKVRVPDKA